MAIFEIKNEEYVMETDLSALIHYVCIKSEFIALQGILNIGTELLVNQFLYLQNCAGKRLRTRALHWVLSFDSAGWEWEVDTAKIYNFVRGYMFGYFAGYQCICAVHDNKKNTHVHIVTNPVNIADYRLFHMSQMDYKNLCWDLAISLYVSMGVALQGVSYIDREGNLKKTSEFSFLYENRCIKELPLLDCRGRTTVCPQLKDMFSVA